jgi:thymidine phosphorylase
VRQAGVDLAKKLGDVVAPGDLLYRIYAQFPADLQFARQACQKSTGYSIGQASDVPHAFVEF